MRHLRYVGLNPRRLRDKTALVMARPLPNTAMAQFDDLSLPESHGWVDLPANRFRAIDRRVKG